MSPGRVAAVVGGALCAAALLGLLLVAAVVGAVGAAPSGSDGTGGAPGMVPVVPAAMAEVYLAAAATCPGLPAELLAAIGTVESGNGTSDAPGVHSGANAAGAQGPMQFEPATFAEYDLPVPPGGADPPSPYDPVDAVYAAARLLCANGAAGAADIPAAVFAYNHSLAYVAEVMDLAGRLSGTLTPGS